MWQENLIENLITWKPFRKPDRKNKQNKLSWAWQLWMVELGAVYSASSWTRTLSSESLFFPSKMNCQPDLQRVQGFPMVPTRNVPTLPSLSQSPPSTVVYRVAFPCLWGRVRLGSGCWNQKKHSWLPHSHVPSLSFGVSTLGDQIPGWHFWPCLKLSVLVQNIISLLCKWYKSNQEHAAQGRGTFYVLISSFLLVKSCFSHPC